MFDFANELILAKIELNVKWFMLGYIDVKVSWTISLSVKINSRIRSYNFLIQVESVIFRGTKHVKINSTPL